MILATLHHSLITSDEIVFLANEGSSVPHSVLVDGVIEELLDPPTFCIPAGPTPLPISEEDLR